MKKICLLLVLVLAATQLSLASEIQQKAEDLALAYQQAEGLNAAETQEALDLLVDYFTTVTSGGIISPAMQSEVNAILDAISGTVSQLASTVHFTVSGTLSVLDPTYQRVVGAVYDPLNLCRTQGTLSGVGTNVYYQVIAFSVLQAGDVDIEVVTGGFDTYLHLYCDFNPASPADNLIVSNDDGGSSLLSRINIPNLPVGHYYIVVNSFGNGAVGNYDVEFRSDSGVLELGMMPLPVPFNYWWAVGVFMALGMFFVVRRMVR